MDKNVARLRSADAIYQGHCQTVASNAYEIERAVIDADLVIGAVLVPGAKAPELISDELVSRMKPGSVLVDIAIDQGGCFAGSRPTTHADPTYRVHDSLFYCVANMPGAVPHTSTYALDQRHPALRGRAGQPGLARRAACRPRARARAAHPRGQPDLRTGRGRARPAVRARQRGPQLTTAGPATVTGAVSRYLDHLTVERGLAVHTLAAYRRDLLRYQATLAAGAGR